MSLIPWRQKQADREEPSRSLAPVAELRSEVDRLFDAFLRDPFGSLAERFGGRSGWEPALDIAENGSEVTVRAELPGVDPKDLEVTVTGNRLTLSGEKKETREQREQGYYHNETRYGSFQRVVELPSGVDADHVTAEHANGVVTIHLKKPQSAAARRIPVKTE